MEGSWFYRLEKLVCPWNARLSFRRASGWESQRTARPGGTFTATLIRGGKWTLHSQADLKTRCVCIPHQLVVRDTALGTGTPFSPKNVLAAFLTHLTHKLILTWKRWQQKWLSRQTRKSKTRTELVFFWAANYWAPHDIAIFWSREHPALCSQYALYWLSLPKSCYVAITYFHVNVSQGIMSLLRTCDFPNMVLDTWMNEWMNEWMKSMRSAYTFFTTRWQMFFGKSICKLSQKESSEN